MAQEDAAAGLVGVFFIPLLSSSRVVCSMASCGFAGLVVFCFCSCWPGAAPRRTLQSMSFMAAIQTTARIAAQMEEPPQQVPRHNTSLTRLWRQHDLADSIVKLLPTQSLAVLPTLTARAGEEPPAFAERTATDLANELGIAATPHTTEEKRAAHCEKQERSFLEFWMFGMTHTLTHGEGGGTAPAQA